MAAGRDTWKGYLKSFLWAPEPMQIPAVPAVPAVPVEFSDFAFKMNAEREKNYKAEREAYEFTGELGALVLKKEMGEKVTIRDFNALFARLPVNKTYNIDYLIGIPGRMSDVIPFLQQKNYRLDQPVFYDLLTKKLPNPDLLSQIFTPLLYSPRPIMVEGIYTASVYRSDVYRKNIIILGDTHTPESNCPGSIVISDYIEKILHDNPGHVFDIFVEADYIKDDVVPTPYYEQGFLFGHMLDTFGACLIPDKTRCPYKNLRMHYADMRYYKGPLNYISRILQHMLYTFESNKKYSLEEVVRQMEALGDVKRVTEELILLVNDGRRVAVTKKIDILSWVERSYKIYRQLQKCPYKQVAEYLVNYLEKKIPEDGQLDEFLAAVNDILRKLEHKSKLRSFAGSYDKEVRAALSAFLKEYGYMRYFINAIMDVYLMARMFSKFKGDPEAIAEPRNIIIMAGDTHCGNYRRMIDEMFTFVNIGKTKLATTPPDDKCIDMSQFPLSQLF